MEGVYLNRFKGQLAVDNQNSNSKKDVPVSTR